MTASVSDLCTLSPVPAPLLGKDLTPEAAKIDGGSEIGDVHYSITAPQS